MKEICAWEIKQKNNSEPSQLTSLAMTIMRSFVRNSSNHTFRQCNIYSVRSSCLIRTKGAAVTRVRKLTLHNTHINTNTHNLFVYIFV